MVREFKIFRQKFITPLRTAHGLWEVRNSILLKETHEDSSYSFGEVAPTPGFNNYSLDDALKEAKVWKQKGNKERYRCINTAISSVKSFVWKKCSTESRKVIPASLYFEAAKVPKNCSVIKRKIGLKSQREEILDVLNWLKKLPATVGVRLDPNQSLNFEKLQGWTDALEGNRKVEFIEQPVPGIPCDKIINLMTESGISMALDEAIITHGGLRKIMERGWGGYFVVKPTLLHNWSDSLSFIKEYPDKCVVSTAFESPIGYEAVIRACMYSNLVPGIDRSVFKGCRNEFKLHHNHSLNIPSVKNDSLNVLWNSL